jgi:hypothetical protein
MEPGFRSPLVDFFRRGEVARDVRLTAAQGALAPRAHEQLALLILLSDDPEPEISTSANATLDALPVEPLQAFLARSDVPGQMRDFFAARGVSPGALPAADATEPLVDAAADEVVDDMVSEETTVSEETKDEEEDAAAIQDVSRLSIVQRMKLGMKGTKAHRARLIRDSNKLVAAAVLSSPKLTESEVEAFAKMANVSEEVLRTIAMNRTWVKNYGVVAGLTRNPKTPPGISMQMVQRLNERDLKMLTMDRNVPEAVRLAARKFLRKGPKDMS